MADKNLSNSIRISDPLKKKLEEAKDISGLSFNDIISFSMYPPSAKCRICGKAFIEHAFIFSHQFKPI